MRLRKLGLTYDANVGGLELRYLAALPKYVMKQ